MYSVALVVILLEPGFGALAHRRILHFSLVEGRYELSQGNDVGVADAEHL